MSKPADNNGFILCLKVTEDSPVTIYKSLDGIFYPVKENISDEEALETLRQYSRVIAVFLHRSDIFSGLYIHEDKSKNLDVHIKKVLHNVKL